VRKEQEKESSRKKAVERKQEKESRRKKAGERKREKESGRKKAGQRGRKKAEGDNDDEQTERRRRPDALLRGRGRIERSVSKQVGLKTSGEAEGDELRDIYSVARALHDIYPFAHAA